MWDLPEPVYPALAGGFLTTAPPGKSKKIFFLNCLAHLTLQVCEGGGDFFFLFFIVFAAHSSVVSLCRCSINTDQMTKWWGRGGSGYKVLHNRSSSALEEFGERASR